MGRWLGSLASVALVLMLWAPGAMAGSILVVGDSISAALGLDTKHGWVSLLQQRLREQGLERPVVNASISGDTSAGGLARLPALLKQHQPELVIIELGGNDGLRGQPPAQLQQNLSAMVDQSQASGAQVILLGMQLPPNYGSRYTQAFSQVFARVAQDKQVGLVPFFLEGVAGVPGMMQNDGIHPTASAQSRLLESAWPLVKERL
jgi:acyl-CoA thioesterase-1